MTHSEFQGRLLRLRTLCQQRSGEVIFDNEQAEYVANAREFVDDNKDETSGYRHRMIVANTHWKNVYHITKKVPQ